MSQFFYRRVIPADPKNNTKEEVVYDSFNPECVVRGVWYENSFIVLLNDGHETSEYTEPPRWNKEGKKVSEGKKERTWKVSEIALDKEDAAKFRRVTELTDWDDTLVAEGKLPEPEFEETLVQTND